MKIEKIIGATKNLEIVFCELTGGVCMLVRGDGSYLLLDSIAIYYWRCSYPPVFVDAKLPEEVERQVRDTFEKVRDTEEFNQKYEKAKAERGEIVKKENIMNYEKRIIESGKGLTFDLSEVEKIVGKRYEGGTI